MRPNIGLSVVVMLGLLGCQQKAPDVQYQSAPAHVVGSFSNFVDSIAPLLDSTLKRAGYRLLRPNQRDTAVMSAFDVGVDQVTEIERDARVFEASLAFEVVDMSNPNGVLAENYVSLTFVNGEASKAWLLLTNDGYLYNPAKPRDRSDLPFALQAAIKTLCRHLEISAWWTYHDEKVASSPTSQVKN
jgi:hypothetical protein